MKQIIATIIMVMCVGVLCAAETASSLLSKVSEKIVSAKTLTADFKIKASDGSVSYGDFAADGDKYALSASAMATVSNGKYQWTIDDQLKEVTIIEPTPEEIAQVNPFAIIRNYSKNYKIKLLGDAGGMKRVELIPNKSDGINRIILSVNPKTMLPTTLELSGEDGTSVKIEITNLRLGVNIPQSRFVINMKDFPLYEYIDMR